MTARENRSVPLARLTGLRPSLTLVLALSVCVLAACGGKKDGGATQVAAKINKSEVSVHQINFLLQRQPNLRPEQIPAASKRALEGLIDQELALQAANEQKLDRSPQVVMAIEAAKREIVARAYLEKLGGAAAKPNEDEVTRYFNEHPGLFSDRKIYTLREVNVEVAADKAKDLSTKAAVVKSEEFVASLKNAGIRHAARQITQPAENLPLDLVAKLTSVAEGKSIVNMTPTGFTIVYVLAAKPAPVTEQQSRPAIEAFILNDRKRKLVAQGMKSLRESAKIEYLGQFAGGPGATPMSDPVPTAPSLESSASSPLDDKAMQKGLQGLK